MSDDAPPRFAPSTTRVVGTLPGMQPGASSSSSSHDAELAPLVPYLLPASELRRLLEEARADARLTGNAFNLTYTRLAKTPQGAVVDARRVTLLDDDGHHASCVVDDTAPCAADELALAPPIGATPHGGVGASWLTSLLLAFPVPLRPDGGDVGCLA